MTANELAQLIEDAHPRGFVKDAADLLRQQEAALLAEQKHNEMLMAEIEQLKNRELTEDEIREVADSVCHTWKKNGVGELYMTDFARAILKKAS